MAGGQLHRDRTCGLGDWEAVSALQSSCCCCSWRRLAHVRRLCPHLPLSAVHRGTVTRLLSRRRLILILDLDHTLLNSVHLGEVGEDAAPKLAELQQQEEVGNGGGGQTRGR